MYAVFTKACYYTIVYYILCIMITWNVCFLHSIHTKHTPKIEIRKTTVKMIQFPYQQFSRVSLDMMTSSNGTIFRSRWIPAQRPVTRSFDVFFDLRLNKRLSKQPWGWWFETPSWSLWRQCNDFAWIVPKCVFLFTTDPSYLMELLRRLYSEMKAVWWIDTGVFTRFEIKISFRWLCISRHKQLGLSQYVISF